MSEKVAGNAPSHIVVARLFLIDPHTGKMLIVQRAKSAHNNPMKWEVPGGTLKNGELPSRAIHRELEEETGITEFEIDLRIGPIVETYIMHSGENDGGLYIAHYHVGTMAGTDRAVPELPLELNSELQAGRWVSYKELENYDLTRGTRKAAIELKSWLVFY